MPTRLRSILVNLLVLALSIALFFGLAELLLRASGRISVNALRSPDLETLASIPGIFEPGQDFVDRMLPQLPFRVRTNSLGFRGPEISRERPAGVFRILCLGDSYTFGPYVEQEQTLPARLEARMRGSSGEPRVEVVNGGVSGFTIPDELIFLRERALGLDPDLVLVFFSQNDIQDLARTRPMIDLMEEHAGLKSTPLLGPALKLLQHTALFNLMQRTAARLRGRPAAPAAAPAVGAGPPAPGDNRSAERQWELYATHLRQMAELLRREEIPLILFSWPSARQVEGVDSTEPQNRLSAEAAKADVPFLDLTAAVTALDGSGVPAFLVPIDGHPTAAAYDAASAEVARFIEEQGFGP